MNFFCRLLFFSIYYFEIFSFFGAFFFLSSFFYFYLSLNQFVYLMLLLHIKDSKRNSSSLFRVFACSWCENLTRFLISTMGFIFSIQILLCICHFPSSLEQQKVSNSFRPKTGGVLHNFFFHIKIEFQKKILIFLQSDREKYIKNFSSLFIYPIDDSFTQ